ncbi:trimeric intracellular cation channel family protein [Pseudomonas syringae]|uniref:trimeric intracellular cation channel family protein n=1 Tax=Pseudomonas syringae TaxID=317 RepID=UPI001E52402C|nr:TRIC cation channel family protein [Pseudomonas syringae]
MANSFGLAVFTVTGTDMALQQNLPPSIAVIMGVATAVAWGLMRDVLSDEIPLAFCPEVYASISILGAVACITLLNLQFSLEVACVIAIAFVLVSCIAAIRWK